MLVDTHCHLHDGSYDWDREDVYGRAIAAGVRKMVTVGTNVEDSFEAVRFAEEHEGVFAVVGIHPGFAREARSFDLNFIAKSQTSDSLGKVVAVGEVGLDYHYPGYDREAQIRLLEEMLEMAQRADLPVVLHVREAFEDFWAVVENFSGLRGELHSFSDSWENLEKGLEKGFYVGVNGLATFVREVGDVVKRAPLERILLETDAPYLTPAPYRGKVNEPAYVAEVAKWVAVQRGMSLEEVEEITTKNAETFFGI